MVGFSIRIERGQVSCLGWSLGKVYCLKITMSNNMLFILSI